MTPTAEVAPATPEPAATAPVTPTGVTISVTVTDTVQTSPASIIPHLIQGNEACLACHAVTSPIEPAPPNHAGFDIELCQNCHLLTAE
jgi:hypothetical protein